MPPQLSNGLCHLAVPLQRVSIKSLQEELDALKQQVIEANAAKDAAQTQLQQAQSTIDEQAAALETAAAHTATNEGDASDETAPGPGTEQNTRLPKIPRPQVPKGKRIRIRQGMQISYRDYKDIQRTIHKLVFRVNIDWKVDYRLQDISKLSLLYRSAEQAHPILTRYEDNWAITELTKMYLQNMCEHGRREGWLERKGKRGRTTRGGARRGDTSDEEPATQASTNPV
ncbi:hypothetical protein C8Q78DRAFT_991699 [Trametes maxima]|nr:hypothetical protein C8Q78DRAFT_991699 [Trametes maxima]